ncbi:MAG: cytidylate kinase family protein [Treponema sp.]|nr:cytidylate kinase family protein [Treponema sp.]
MKKNIKIAVSGRSGCGNTTVSKMVADTLNLRFINFTFRSLAQERGLDLKTVLELAAEDDSWDREVDTRQVQIARGNDASCAANNSNANGCIKNEQGCVLGSRLAIWLLEEADIKIYLDASPEIRARRIVGREGGNAEEITAFTHERDRQDHGRYLRIYNIDTDNHGFADLTINTDHLTPEQITDIIVEKVKNI